MTGRIIVFARTLSLCSLLVAVGCSGGADSDVDGGPPIDAFGPGINPDASGPTPDAGPGPMIDAGTVGPGPSPLAMGVRIEEVALFQGVKITLAEAGSPVAAGARNAPIVGGRDGRFRIYVAGATRELTAEVRMLRGREVRVFSDTRTLVQPSVDGTPRSTFEVDVPGEWLTSDSRFSVAIVESSGTSVPLGSTNEARFPLDGTERALDAIDDPGGFQLVLVPFSWESDGSGRLPDTSPEQIELLRAHFGAIFPYASVQIEVHDALAWSGGLTWRGNVDFGDMNSRLVSLRAEESAPPEVYYYGLVAPAESRSAYCGRSCVTGQAFVVDDPDDARIRVGSGLGFAGERTARTLQHELGHIHGRGHAPCETSRGLDPSYPYPGGAIGVWGYDRLADVYYSPESSDVMGYCDDRWISDYNYRGIFERHLAIHRLTSTAAQARRPSQHLSFVRIDEAGRATLLRDVILQLPRSGRTRIEWISSAGRSIAWDQAAYVEQSHSEETLLLLPDAPEGAIAFRWAGGALTALPEAR